MSSPLTLLLVFLGISSLQQTGVLACSGDTKSWFAGNCFSVTGSRHFKDVAEECTAKGSVLTSIRNADENEAIRKALNNSKVAEASIGLDYDEKYEKYFWLDGTLLNYTNYGDTACKETQGCYFLLDATTGKWKANIYYYNSYNGACRNAKPNEVDNQVCRNKTHIHRQ